MNKLVGLVVVSLVAAGALNASVSPRYRTPGIIGGMGPSATCDLMQKVIDNTDAPDDQHNIHLLVDQNTDVPDRTGVYHKVLATEGVEPVVPDEADQKTVMHLIYGCVKPNLPVERYPRKEVEALMAHLRAQGAEAFLLACTELPIAFERLGYREGLVDPTQVLARKIVETAGAPLRKMGD